MATIEELEREMTPLCHLARHYATDKGGAHLQAGDTCHNYTPAYHELFKDRREQVKWVLEIGVNYGCSLRMWKDYFPRAQIIGLDSNESCLFHEERIACFPADQFNERDLVDVVELLGKPELDLIIDDGSHEPAHQIFSAQVLLPYLERDGIYIIEDIDIDCQPQLIGNPVVQGMPTKDWVWNPIPTGIGLGKARCPCGCGTGEQLVVIRHV
jgi:8-demethyl-8-alpha-L-rhamnosyltetracenomycin-C 2'-O-methyltransferase